jgi:hypothetical protein
MQMQICRVPPGLIMIRRYGGLTCNGPSNEIFMVDMEQLVWRAPLQHVRYMPALLSLPIADACCRCA